MIEKMIRVGGLYDFYGALLTERQQKCIEMHYLQDLSLGEIAADLGVSRQAVNDILRRAEESMEQYESVLKLRELDAKRTGTLRTVQSLLNQALQAKHPSDKALRSALDELDSIFKQEVGTE
jgi:uncharacterized protein